MQERFFNNILNLQFKHLRSNGLKKLTTFKQWEIN